MAPPDRRASPASTGIVPLLRAWATRRWTRRQRLCADRRTAAALAVLFGFGIALRVFLLLAYRPAFLGIPDSGTYVAAAHGSLFLDPVHPVGYPLFLRLVHALSPHLTATIFVQHVFGVATAAVLFVAVARATGDARLALLPAAVVLLGGLQLYVEHTPLSDTLFSFLVSCALALALPARRDPAGWRLVGLGVVLAAATCVRTVGLLLIPVLAVWLGWGATATRARRWCRAAAPAAVSLALVMGYVVLQHHQSGVWGLTAADGRITYAVAAPFANCSRFTPPAGTRGLCERTASAQRGSTNQYLYGYPDHGSGLPPGGRAAVSPAWRLFGPIPGGNAQLGGFGRAAILHQPLDYLSQVARNVSAYWRGSPRAFLTAAARPDPGIDQVIASYYATGLGTTVTGFALFRSYARIVEIDGAVLVLLLLASLTPLASPRGRRGVALLLAAVGWVLLVGSAAIAVDPRYTLPANGPLAAAASVGVAELWSRWRRSRVRRHSR